MPPESRRRPRERTGSTPDAETDCYGHAHGAGTPDGVAAVTDGHRPPTAPTASPAPGAGA